MAKKIKKTKLSKTSGSGINAITPKPQNISFSLKYYQANHPKFSGQGKAPAYWLTLLERLKALSCLSAQDLMVNRSAVLRCHPIRWAETSESRFGLPNEEQLVDTPYQFSISSNEHGRVHGFFIGEVFYIVWLDPDHLLYSAKK